MSDFIEEMQTYIDKTWDMVHEMGIDPYPVEFYVVPAEALYEMSAYGISNHWHHWSYGRDYWVQRDRLEKGYGRLYEMVINSNPSIAYLLESNTVASQKLVVPHVYGHCHVFKNNYLLNAVRSDMPLGLAGMSDVMSGYEETYGIDRVEGLLDAAMSISAQVDDTVKKSKDNKKSSDPYRDLFDKSEPLQKEYSYSEERKKRFDLPTVDLLGFVANNAPFLDEWERNVLKMVRDEALYFRPQRYTKILNEGFATYVHAKFLEMGVMSGGELIEASKVHANVVSNDGLNFNPYWFGWKLLKYIEETRGHETVVDVVGTESDSSLIRNWVDEEFVRKHHLYTYNWEIERGEELADAVVSHTDWEYIRDELANSVGRRPPVISVVEVKRDYTLVLEHERVGKGLDKKWAQLVLKNIKRLWGADIILHDGMYELTTK